MGQNKINTKLNYLMFIRLSIMFNSLKKWTLTFFLHTILRYYKIGLRN